MILLDYLRLILRRWWLVVLPVVVITGLTLAIRPVPVTVYQVKMRFAVGLPPEKVPGVYTFDRHYDWLASEYFTRGVQDMLTTSKFAGALVGRLSDELRVSPGITGAIQGALRSDYRASVIDVFVTWGDPTVAAQVAQAVIDELNQNSSAYWPQLTDAKVSPVRVLDAPVPVPLSIDLRSRFELPVRIGLGLGLGVLLAFLAHYIDRVVHDRREVELLGLTVIGDIPKS